MPPVPKHPTIAPLTNNPRPPLPHDHFNTYIKNLDVQSKPPQVKFQRIARPPKEVLVGRMKIQTPDSGHAFILRRYDTGAISITTLFKAAFPTAPESAERDEIAWVSHNYDLTGANGGTEPDRVRFSGRWAPPNIAQMLADAYGFGHILPLLIASSPDPVTAYRGSGKQAPGTPAGANRHTVSSPAPVGPPPAKRRKEDSSSPVKSSRAASPAVATPAPVRRSTRARATKSPQPQPVRASSRKPPSRAQPQPAPSLAVLSDATVVGEENFEEEAEAHLQPDINEDLREQAELIDRLKRERDAAQAAKAAEAAEAGDTLEKEAAKRSREDESAPHQFEFKEPETEERALITNPRVRSLRSLPPERKSLAWGALAFAAGVGAVTLLPNLNFLF